MSETPAPRSAAGYTTADVARIRRVSEDKVRRWITTGELFAINTSDRRCSRPRYVVPPEALADFDRRRAAATPDVPKPKRRKRLNVKNYFPD